MLRPATLFVGLFCFLLLGATVASAQDSEEKEEPSSKIDRDESNKPPNFIMPVRFRWPWPIPQFALPISALLALAILCKILSARYGREKPDS